MFFVSPLQVHGQTVGQRVQHHAATATYATVAGRSKPNCIILYIRLGPVSLARASVGGISSFSCHVNPHKYGYCCRRNRNSHRYHRPPTRSVEVPRRPTLYRRTRTTAVPSSECCVTCNILQWRLCACARRVCVSTFFFYDTCDLCRAEKTSSDMSVDEDSSSSEEGEKDSSSDSSCSDSESNDEKKDDVPPPAAVSPPRQEEQEEEPKWYLKNFLKKNTPDTNNTTRTSQQVRVVRVVVFHGSILVIITRWSTIEL